MNLEELYALTKWIQTEIVEEQVLHEYQQLLNVVAQNSQSNQQTPFENEKENLIETLDATYLGTLTKDQLKFLESMKILPYLGEKGIKNLEDILYKNSLDIATAVQKLQQIVTDLGQGIEKNKQLINGLKGCVAEPVTEVSDEVLLRVCFQGEAAMNNIKDFKEWGASWHIISHGVAKAHGASADEVRVIGAAKGSVIIELATIASIACTVSAIILSALKVAEKVLQLKGMATDVRIKNLQADILEEQLKEAAEKQKEEGIQTIIDEQKKAIKLKQSSDGDKITALEKSISKLVDFIEKGGEVDFVVPEEEFDEEENPIQDDYDKVRSQAEEIRQLEEQLKLIEDQSEDDES